MDKIINTKEKFYLLKKHMRKDDYESLIKDSNKSLLNILQLKKSQNNEDNKTINHHLEKQKDLLFSISSFPSNQHNKNSNEKMSNIESNKNFNENQKEKNELKHNQINKKKGNLLKKQIKNLDINNSNLLSLNNEKLNNELEEIKKNNDSISESEDESSSSDSIFISNKNEEKDKMEIERKKSSNTDCYFKNVDYNIFDNKYMLDCENDLLIDSNSYYSSINNLNDNKNIENNNNNNFNNISINNNKNQIKIDKNNIEKNQKIKNIQNKEQKHLIQNNKKQIINQEDKKHIKKIKNNEIIKNTNNNIQKVKTIYSPFNDMELENEMNMKEKKTTNLTINNNSNINDNNNNNKIIVNQTNIITNTNIRKIQIPIIDLDKFDTSSNKKNNINKLEKVKDNLKINNNMNINTNKIDNEIKKNNQNIKVNDTLNQKKDFQKKENKIEHQILINNKIIIDDDDENQKKIHKEKKKIEDNKIKEKSIENPYVSLNGTQIKLKLDDNQILLFEEEKRSLENHHIKKESSVEKNYIKPLIKNKNNPHKNNLNIVENKILKQITINNNNNKELNNDNKKNLNLNTEKEKDKEKSIEKGKEIFTKKESSAYLLSKLFSIIKNMKENFKLDYQDNYKNMKISKVIDEILNNISSMEKLETNKRRKNSFKQVPKLISILFKSLEEVKRNEIILKNVIEILDSVKLFFHQMKLNYLKKDEKIPINFTQLKTVIKYIYTLFQIKVYNSKCLKGYMKNEDNKKLLKFVQVYKSYQNSTEKLFHILKKISEDKQLKKYDNLNLYLEMDPLKIKHYGECYKQGRKMIDFIFEYFERSNSNEKKK